MKIEVKYIDQGISRFSHVDTMDYLPRVGEIIINEELADRGCSGRFVINDIFHTKTSEGFKCTVKCIEISDEDDMRFRLQESGHL